MQQQRHFTGFLAFFLRGTSHYTAILHCCVAHLYASKGFQPLPALQCPWLLRKTLSNLKNYAVCCIAGKKNSRNLEQSLAVSHKPLALLPAIINTKITNRYAAYC